MQPRFLLIFTLGILTALLYALLTPKEVGGGYFFTPVSAVDLVNNRSVSLYATSLPPRTVAAHSSEYLGYLDLPDGRVRSRHRRAYNMAVTPWGFANYGEAPSSVVVQSPEGSPLFTLSEPGYPVGRGGGLFHLHANGYEVSEYDQQGTLLWTLGGVTPVTALDAIPGQRALGFLSGALYHRVAVPPGGESDAPTWTRLRLPEADVEVVYDVSFSSNGEALLVRSGLEPQSVSYFDLNEGVAEPRWTYEPAVSSMRSEPLSLLNSREVAVEVSREVHVLDSAVGTLLRRYEEATLGDTAEFREAGLSLYTLGRDGDSRQELHIIDTNGAELYLANHLEPGFRLAREGTLLILARGGRIGILEVSRK